MRQKKLTVADSISQGPRRPGVKLGVKSPPPPTKSDPVEQVRVRKLVARKSVAPVYEVTEPISVREAVERARASKHKFTDAEVERVVHLVSGWAAKKQKSAAKNTSRIQTAVDMVAKERDFPSQKRLLVTTTSITPLSIRPTQGTTFVQDVGAFDADKYLSRERCPTPVVVTVTDRYGTPIMGALVTFMIDAKNSYFGTFPGGRQMATIVTNENGAATAPTVTTGRFAGTCKVVATLTTGRFVDTFTVAATASDDSVPIIFALTTPSLEKHPPVTETSTRLPLISELEWPVLPQEILTRAISKHKLTNAEVARIIAMANGWAAKNKSSVINHGWVASGIGTVLRER